MEDHDPQDARFYNLGCNFYELAVSTGYDHRDANRLMDMVELSVDQETGDELVPFWDALRDHAIIDSAFCKMLIDTRIMERDEIFGLPGSIDEAIHDAQWPDDDEDNEYLIMDQDEYEQFHKDQNY